MQTSPSLLNKDELAKERFRIWSTEFASALLGKDVEFWYDQFLAKPPHEGARTPWHQDEAYWGRNLDERGITCWMPFHDVDVENGCMHFVPRAHLEGVIPHRSQENVQSDLLVCDVDAARDRAGAGQARRRDLPPRQDAAHDHARTRRRAGAARSRSTSAWSARKGEGDHYPWKIYVNQMTGERFKPKSAR